MHKARNTIVKNQNPKLKIQTSTGNVEKIQLTNPNTLVLARKINGFYWGVPSDCSRYSGRIKNTIWETYVRQNLSRIYVFLYFVKPCTGHTHFFEIWDFPVRHRRHLSFALYSIFYFSFLFTLKKLRFLKMSFHIIFNWYNQLYVVWIIFVASIVQHSLSYKTFDNT